MLDIPDDRQKRQVINTLPTELETAAAEGPFTQKVACGDGQANRH